MEWTWAAQLSSRKQNLLLSIMMGFNRREKAPEVRLGSAISSLTLQQGSQQEQQDHRSHLLAAAPQIRCFPKPHCSAAVPTPSLNPEAHPELQPQWVQAHKPSLLPLIATNHHLCALMLEDLRQRSAPGIHTAAKNEPAIFTLVTQRQQQLCRDP